MGYFRKQVGKGRHKCVDALKVAISQEMGEIPPRLPAGRVRSAYKKRAARSWAKGLLRGIHLVGSRAAHIYCAFGILSLLSVAEEEERATPRALRACGFLVFGRRGRGCVNYQKTGSRPPRTFRRVSWSGIRGARIHRFPDTRAIATYNTSDITADSGRPLFLRLPAGELGGVHPRWPPGGWRVRPLFENSSTVVARAPLPGPK